MTGAVKPAVSSTCSVVPRGNWELSSAVMVRDSSVARFLPILLMSCGMGRSGCWSAVIVATDVAWWGNGPLIIGAHDEVWSQRLYPVSLFTLHTPPSLLLWSWAGVLAWLRKVISVGKWISVKEKIHSLFIEVCAGPFRQILKGLNHYQIMTCNTTLNPPHVNMKG